MFAFFSLFCFSAAAGKTRPIDRDGADVSLARVDDDLDRLRRLRAPAKAALRIRNRAMQFAVAAVTENDARAFRARAADAK